MNYTPSSKIEKLFRDFLENHVNLNQTRVDRIKSADEILSAFISNLEEFKDLYIETIPQGSYRQKTIIKPVGDKGEFDVDLLIVLKNNNSWEPRQYLEKLAIAFKDSKRYEDLTDTYGKTRCVTIDYEGDFHVDLVPAIKDGLGMYWICNKKTNKLERTDGDGYANWFSRQDLQASGFLVPVVRLIKYLRDEHSDFDTKSIILTTIAGMCVSGPYNSLPEAFSNIVKNMSDYLSMFSSPPPIQNPAMPEETFERHWQDDSEGFVKLRSALDKYSAQSLNAISCNNEDRGIKIWQEIFGNNFTASATNLVSPTINLHRDTDAFTPTAPWSD